MLSEEKEKLRKRARRIDQAESRLGEEAVEVSRAVLARIMRAVMRSESEIRGVEMGSRIKWR